MGVFSIPLSTTQLSQTLLPHLTQRHLDFQTVGDVFALRGIQLRKAAGQKFREDLSKVGVDLNPGLVKSLLLVLVQVDDGFFDLALITNHRLHHVLQRRFLLLNAVNHVHDLGVDLVLHPLESTVRISPGLTVILLLPPRLLRSCSGIASVSLGTARGSVLE